MRFFVPNLKDDTKADQVWEELRKGVSRDDAKEWQATHRRVFRIWCRHNARSWVAEVGKGHPEDAQEQVYAIFDTFGPCYLVCTPKRGVFAGGPYYVGKDDTDDVEDFESDSR